MYYDVILLQCQIYCVIKIKYNSVILYFKIIIKIFILSIITLFIVYTGIALNERLMIKKMINDLLDLK